MAVFVGGQLVLAVAVVPALRRDRRGCGRWRGASGGRRWSLWAYWWSPALDGLAYRRWDDGTLHVKLALVVLVGVLILWHLRKGAAHWLQGAIFLVSLAIVWLGLALAH